jgi:hypothetical protein
VLVPATIACSEPVAGSFWLYLPHSQPTRPLACSQVCPVPQPMLLPICSPCWCPEPCLADLRGLGGWSEGPFVAVSTRSRVHIMAVCSAKYLFSRDGEDICGTGPRLPVSAPCKYSSLSGKSYLRDLLTLARQVSSSFLSRNER